MAFLGKFADQVANGNVFSVSTVVAGLAIPVSTTTAPTLVLWNPIESGVRLVPLRYSVAGSSGTAVATGVGFQFAAGAGRTTATGQVVTVFARSQINPARLGSGTPSKALASAAGTNTLTAAIVNFIGPVFHIGKEVINTDITPTTSINYDFEGLLQMEPGTLIFPVGTAASSALYQQTLYWAEVPL